MMASGFAQTDPYGNPYMLSPNAGPGGYARNAPPPQAPGMAMPPGFGRSAMYGSSFLPYEDRTDNALSEYETLINNVRNTQVDPRDLDAARNRARQEAAARGLDGPLAAGLATQSQDRVISDYAKLRQDRLNQMMIARYQMISAQQQAEFMRKEAAYNRGAQSAQNSEAQQMAIWSGAGATAGGIVGSIFPVIGTAAGAGIGAGLGAIGSIVF